MEPDPMTDRQKQATFIITGTLFSLILAIIFLAPLYQTGHP
jgi:hypothetical protein